MIEVILVEPEKEGNVGAVARVMKNFGFTKLVLINPKIKHLSKQNVDRAKWAKDVLENALITDFSYFKKIDLKVATTARVGRDYNMPRVPITPKQLAQAINKVNIAKSKIGIIIGREGNGLTNEEIMECDFVVSIPSTKEYPTLNVSHAVGIILYELFNATSKKKSTDGYRLANSKDKEIIFKYLNKVLDKMKWQYEQRKKTQKILWKRLVGKSFLTKREAMALIGFLKKLL